MKKSILFMILILGAFPAYLQAQNVELPAIEIKVSQDKVPPAVKAAVIRDFGEGHQPMVWAKANTKFDTYGWEQTVNVENTEIYYYSLHTQTTVGSELDAVYTPDGKLVRSREDVINFEPPQSILASLGKSAYKDWKITKDVHLIKVNEVGKIKEHYDLLMQKGKEKKSVYFDKEGNMLINKRK
jgi:hypothetical protein